MEKFTITRNKRTEIIETAERLIDEGVKVGIGESFLNGVRKKIESVKSSVEGDISIAAIGSFSDGKTTAIAGFAGKVFDDMKIDTDESSDEVKTYKVIDWKSGFVFTDTPGLFGTKEKEVDGVSVRYSDVTKRYISQAHVVVYFCNAKTPLKDSHVPELKKILREWRKLDVTVFVLNKMDIAGYDLLDEENFSQGCSIKRAALVKRLRETIGLTPEEERKLRIVCIAADPGGEGLKEYWFSSDSLREDYKRRSHIGDFRKAVQDVVNTADEKKLRNAAKESSLKDVLGRLRDGLKLVKEPLESALEKCEESCRTLDDETAELRKKLDKHLDDLEKELKDYEAGLKEKVRGASTQDALVGTTQDFIGMKDAGNGKWIGSFEKVAKKIAEKMSVAHREASEDIKNCAKEFKEEFSRQEKYLKEAKEDCAESLKNLPKNSAEAKGGNDLASAVTSGIRFEDSAGGWFEDIGGLVSRVGAGYAAAGLIAVGTGKATATVGVLGMSVTFAAPVVAGVGVVFVFVGFLMKAYAEKKRKEELRNSINSVCGSLDELFTKVCEKIRSEDFFKKFASGYPELCKALEARKGEIGKLKKRLDEREKYARKIDEAEAILGK